MSQNGNPPPGPPEKLFVGIDAGSVSINCAVINGKREFVFEYPYQRHFGKVEEKTGRMIEDLFDRFGKTAVESISFTGNHGKKLSDAFGAFYEFETISQVVGSIFLEPDVRSILSMGGQDTALFQISHESSGWELEYFNTNGPCAAGT